jgi:Transglycosylase-like domain
MTVLLALLAFAAPSPDRNEHPAHRAHHRGCNTHRCDRRMARKAHRQTIRRWRRVARPYRGWLARVRWCESRGRYGINTGNGFHGAYQFTLSSWYAVGGRGRAPRAAPPKQDPHAVRLLWIQGRGAWPVCG